MLMKNKDMAERINILERHGNETGEWGYAVARNIKKMKEEVAPYLEMAAKTFKEFAVPDENDPKKKIVKNDIWEREMGEISDIFCDVDIYMVPVELFIEQGLTATEMEKLLWMVKED